jgi:hypothetical protein
MPYIHPEIRKRLDHGGVPYEPGELAYILNTDILRFLPKRPRFADYATVFGVLILLLLELWHRLVRPYENKKWDENGDVYDLTDKL